MTRSIAVLMALLAGATSGAVVARFVLRAPPSWSIRTNVDGKSVPVVLGWAVLAGSAAGLAVVVLLGADLEPSHPVRAAGPLLALMFFVGLWDDRRGDERPRGFSGHLGALRSGAITGGIVKLIGGGVAGLLAMQVLLEGVEPTLFFGLGAVTIALAANLINLFDRAPGRASKVFLLASVPLAVLSPDWRLVAAGTLGAVLATMPVDLAARGMLGDSGANPMGALLGLGLVLSTGGSVSSVAVSALVLLGLNLVSERRSFSKVITETSWLARLDHLGRK